MENATETSVKTYILHKSKNTNQSKFELRKASSFVIESFNDTDSNKQIFFAGNTKKLRKQMSSSDNELHTKARRKVIEESENIELPRKAGLLCFPTIYEKIQDKKPDIFMTENSGAGETSRIKDSIKISRKRLDAADAELAESAIFEQFESPRRTRKKTDSLVKARKNPESPIRSRKKAGTFCLVI